MANPTIDLTNVGVYAQGEYLFVKIIPLPDKSPSGLVLPESDFEIGELITIGNLAQDELDAMDQPEVPNSQVLFLKKSGMTINIPEPHKFLHFKEVLAMLEPEE